MAIKVLLKTPTKLSLNLTVSEWRTIKHALETYTACSWGSATALRVDNLIRTIGSTLPAVNKEIY